MHALTIHLTRLGLGGIGSHIIWTAFAGMGIGMAIESTKTGWRKWRPAIICFLIVVVAHSVFDMGGSGIGLGVIMAVPSGQDHYFMVNERNETSC